MATLVDSGALCFACSFSHPLFGRYCPWGMDISCIPLIDLGLASIRSPPQYAMRDLRSQQ
jgi:hypothetical protein